MGVVSVADLDAAVAGAGIEHCGQLGRSGAVEDALHERQVHAADQLGLVLGRRVEGAVRQRRAVGPATSSKPAAARARSRQSRCLAPAGRGRLAGDLVEGVADRRAASLGPGHGRRQQPGRQLVAALGKADLDLHVGPPIALGRSARTRPTPSHRPPVLGRQQPVVDETVEVELGHVVGDPYAGGRLLPGDRVGLRGDEAVQGTARTGWLTAISSAACGWARASSQDRRTIWRHRNV